MSAGVTLNDIATASHSVIIADVKRPESLLICRVCRVHYVSPLEMA